MLGAMVVVGFLKTLMLAKLDVLDALLCYWECWLLLAHSCPLLRRTALS